MRLSPRESHFVSDKRKTKLQVTNKRDGSCRAEVFEHFYKIMYKKNTIK